MSWFLSKPKPVDSTGEAGEPYCSRSCLESAKNAADWFLSDRIAEGAMHIRIKCHICNSLVAVHGTGTIGRRKGLLHMCAVCCRSGSAHTYIESLNECTWCGARLKR